MTFLAMATVFLLTLATVSPILTFVHLWQMKEWRWDRLIDHLKHEQWYRQLFGFARPIVALLILVPLIVFSTRKILFRQNLDLFLSSFLYYARLESILLLLYAGALAGLTVLQIVLRKQPYPVWTKKALSMTGLSLAITVLLIVWSAEVPRIVDFTPRIALALGMPFFIPLVTAISWVILWPLDQFLKWSILHAAESTRKTHPKLTVIGITGSVGKTTTKELLKHLLEPLGAIATPLHINTDLGVAGWLRRVLKDEPGDSQKILIVEMGAYRKGEIALLAEIAKPTIGVLCFVGRQHSGLFGGEQAIAEAKAELLAALPNNGHAYLNADSPLLATLKKYVVCPATLVGTSAHSTVRALDIEETGGGIAFSYDGKKLEVPLAGTHNVTNILLAVSVARALGVSLEDTQRRLRTFTAFEHTFRKREEDGVTILDNTYNASVESFLAGIDWAEHKQATEKVLLFDGIIELGEDEERLHRMIAERAANVFQRAYVLHHRFLRYFVPFFGTRIEVLPAAPARVKKGGLLVCMGRMGEGKVLRMVEKMATRRE